MADIVGADMVISIDALFALFGQARRRERFILIQRSSCRLPELLQRPPQTRSQSKPKGTRQPQIELMHMKVSTSPVIACYRTRFDVRVAGYFGRCQVISRDRQHYEP